MVDGGMPIISVDCVNCKKRTQAVADMKTFEKTGYTILKCSKCKKVVGHIESPKSMGL